MLDGFSSKAIMTKAKAMYGKRLTAEQYKELVHKRTVAEVAEYLRSETSYADALSSIQPTEIRRGQLENLLSKSFFDRYNRLLAFNTAPDSGYYRYIIKQLEVEQLLQMIRLLNSGRADEYITQYPEFMDKYAGFSLMGLAKVRSFDDLLALLAGSPYQSILMRCRPRVGEMIDYTACEMAMMNYYYTDIERIIDASFTGATKRELHEIFDTTIELKNITTVYRLKKYFPDATEQYIKSCIMPRWNRIPERVLDSLIACRDAEEFIKKLTSSPYARFLGSKDYVFIEYSGLRIRYNMCKRYLRFAASAPTAFTAYMVLCEIESANITCIIEGIRYQIPAAEIEKLLVL